MPLTHSEIEELDLIDRYLLRKLEPEVEARFEEHYLACRECVARLEASREAIAQIREACAGHPREAGEKPGWSSWGRLFLLPWPAWGVAAVFSVGMLYVTTVRRPGPPQPGPARRAEEAPALAVVTLESYRTGAAEGPAISPTAAAKPFLLRLDQRGLEVYEKYIVRIVSDSGATVWSAGVITPPGGDWLEVRVDGARVSTGAFWVRLSGARPGAAEEPLREYSLVVK